MLLTPLWDGKARWAQSCLQSYKEAYTACYFLCTNYREAHKTCKNDVQSVKNYHFPLNQTCCTLPYAKPWESGARYGHYVTARGNHPKTAGLCLISYK